MGAQTKAPMSTNSRGPQQAASTQFCRACGTRWRTWRLPCGWREEPSGPRCHGTREKGVPFEDLWCSRTLPCLWMGPFEKIVLSSRTLPCLWVGTIVSNKQLAAKLRNISLGNLPKNGWAHVCIPLAGVGFRCSFSLIQPSKDTQPTPTSEKGCLHWAMQQVFSALQGPRFA